MYNTQVELNEGGGGNYLSIGVQKVFVESLKIEQLATPNYTGNIAKLVLTNDEGKSLEESIFPFKYNPELTKFGTTELLTQDQQLKDYLQKMQEIFARAASGGEESYKKATATASTFEEFVAAVSPLVCKASGGQYIWQLIKANKRGYATIALHKGGSTRAFVEGEACPITFDESKYGKKTLAPSAAETTGAGTDDLPF